MRKEKSCGAIIYRINNKKLEYLLIRQNEGTWGSPKGHMEKGETELDTAIREIKEETNIDAIVDTNFRKEITYYIEEKDIMKTSLYFVATSNSFNIKLQDEEISEYVWLDYEESLNKITYDNFKGIFIEANKYLNKRM